MTDESLAKFFSEKLGLESKKALETTKNAKLSTHLQSLAAKAGIENAENEQQQNKKVGLLLYGLAAFLAKDPPNFPPSKTEFLLKYITSSNAGGSDELCIKSDAQLNAALKYLSAATVVDASKIDEDDFKSSCGIGVKAPTHSEIKAAVETLIEQNQEQLKLHRYAFDMGALLRKLREDDIMRWADGKLLKTVFDDAIEGFLGPKLESDLKAKKKERLPSQKPPQVEADYDAATPKVRSFMGDVAKFHKPGENPQISEEIRKRHLEATQGKVVTRFPPEPNGFLHIGHAKAINFNFNYAKAFNGITYLRYDDTNPEAEEQVFVDAIYDNVNWLGFTPYKITYASDYFDQLYAYAIKLIKKGKAYVCHMSPEEIIESRGGADGKGSRFNSPWRDRPIEENLAEFEKMKNGVYEEGKAILRLKMDMTSGNPCLWDLVAYRILKRHHLRTGDKWIIYPMYDYTHCICDSIENITHSLCTTEFIQNRVAYYWILDELEIYKPVQWEYSRLNLTKTVTSKRKLNPLVANGTVSGLNDPRLYTLAGIRRRGFTADAVNAFVESLGITTVASTVDVHLLESFVREDLNEKAPRVMAVLDPILVKIEEGIPDSFPTSLELEWFPKAPEKKGLRKVPFSHTELFIDASDFSLEPSSDFKRFTPKQPVGLFKAVVIEYLSHEVDPITGKVILIKAKALPASAPQPKAFIQWVANQPSEGSPVKATVRLYSDLFQSNNPQAAPGGILNDVNPDSLVVKPNALIDVGVKDCVIGDVFQFQRLGYFCLDSDSCPSNGDLIFNLTVSLKGTATP